MVDEEKISLLKEKIQQAKKDTALNLSGFYLSQSELERIAPDIAKLKHLTFLDLSWNNFTKVPELLKNLSNLQSLDLSYNNIERLPPFLDEMKSLKKVGVYFNSVENSLVSDRKTS